MAGILREVHQNKPVVAANIANHKTACPDRGTKTPRSHFKRTKTCFEKGMRVWVPDTKPDTGNVWIVATVTDAGSAGNVGVQLDNGERVELKVKDRRPLICGHNDYAEVNDLTQLSPLNEAEVLQSLQVRFKNGQFCSQAGITLVSLNPFREIPGLYNDKAVQRYHHEGSSKNGAPHVFEVAEKAYSSLHYAIGCPNQSIVVSGESGAGKTWNARCLMKYLTSVALYKNPGGFSPPPVKCIERRILDSNPILEAFGNAGTARNLNSSRFGKYIQLQFDRGSHIIGASIQTYLLEKTRVVHQANGESNFHIFYQVVNGATDDQQSAWSLVTPSGDDVTFAYLPLDDVVHKRANANQVFATTQVAMKNVGLTKNHQDNIFQVLAGILHFGNLEFTCEEEMDPCELHEEACQFSLEQACELLGLDSDSLTTSLIFRRITASHSKRKSVFMKPCSVEEAGTRRDCVAKVIYARLFDWLVAFLNKHTSANQWHAFIGLLDIYGFESFQNNSLEQLCINYANEKLQQHFVTYFLRAEQEEYKKEGITWQFCNFNDNQPCVETIEGKLSVFSLMNEECRLNRQSDPTSFEDKLLGAVESPFLTRAPIGHSCPAFTIKHYADDVAYDVYGLIEKNKDPIPLELLEVLTASTNPFVSRAVQPELVRLQELQSKGSKASSSKTVVSRFKESLGSLMKALTATTPHYIRCIKPNTLCTPDSFDSHFVAAQLRACGVLETVAISAAGFPSKISHADFCERYGILVRRHDVDDALSVRGRCRLLYRLLLGEDNKENDITDASEQLGRSKIFLKEGQLECLESLRLNHLSHSATVIQRAWRVYRALSEVEREWAATVIQAGYRGWRVRQAIQVMDDAAIVIQHAMLMYSIRRKRVKLEQSQHKERERTSPAAKSTRKSVHFATNLTTVKEIFSLSPVPTPSPSLSPTTENVLVFTENGPDFESLSPVLGSNDDDDLEDERQTELQGGGGGVVSTVMGLLKTPAVDLVLAGVVIALLVTGPLRWN